MLKVHPWQSGPTELIEYALRHLRDDSDFNRRIAFLLLDVGIETLFRTYLLLPDDVTNSETSYHERRKASEGYFHDLVKGLKAAASSRLKGFDLSHIEFYHDLRNKLYHQGNGITVASENVIGYARDAAFLLKALLDVDLTDNIVLKPDALKELVAQMGEIQSALERLGVDAELVIEAIEHELLLPSVIKNLRGLAVGIDIHNLQEKTNSFVNTIEAAVHDEEIRDWLLNLICSNVSEASSQALANTRFLFNLLSDPVSFYLLIIGAFVLPEGNIEKGFLYSEEDLEVVIDEEYHVLGIYDNAKTFLRLWVDPKGYYLGSSVLDGFVKQGAKKVQQLNSVSTSLRDWIRNR
jgi:hypothetical protein